MEDNRLATATPLQDVAIITVGSAGYAVLVLRYVSGFPIIFHTSYFALEFLNSYSLLPHSHRSMSAWPGLEVCPVCPVLITCTLLRFFFCGDEPPLLQQNAGTLGGDGWEVFMPSRTRTDMGLCTFYAKGEGTKKEGGIA